MLKKNGGITLIALVITIIVLLILAGVSLAMLTDNNGILNKTTYAKEANVLGAAKDQVGLAQNTGITNYFEDQYVKTTSEGLTKQSAVINAINAAKDKLDDNVTMNNGNDLAVSSPEATVDFEIVYSAYKVKGHIDTNGILTWDDIEENK